MNLKEVIFETVEPPRTIKKIPKILGYTLIFLCFPMLIGGIMLSDISIIFPFIGFGVFLSAFIVAYWSDKNIRFYVVQNGFLKIDNTGIHITQGTERHISFDEIKFITYYFDRPLHAGRNPPARTYIVKITLPDKSIAQYYIERFPTVNVYHDFDEVMERIRLSSTYFAARIRYRK